MAKVKERKYLEEHCRAEIQNLVKTLAHLANYNRKLSRVLTETVKVKDFLSKDLNYITNSRWEILGDKSKVFDYMREYLANLKNERDREEA